MRFPNTPSQSFETSEKNHSFRNAILALVALAGTSACASRGPSTNIDPRKEAYRCDVQGADQLKDKIAEYYQRAKLIDRSQLGPQQQERLDYAKRYLSIRSSYIRKGRVDDSMACANDQQLHDEKIYAFIDEHAPQLPESLPAPTPQKPVQESPQPAMKESEAREAVQEKSTAAELEEYESLRKEGMKLFIQYTAKLEELENLAVEPDPEIKNTDQELRVAAEDYFGSYKEDNFMQTGLPKLTFLRKQNERFRVAIENIDNAIEQIEQRGQTDSDLEIKEDFETVSREVFDLYLEYSRKIKKLEELTGKIKPKERRYKERMASLYKSARKLKNVEFMKGLKEPLVISIYSIDLSFEYYYTACRGRKERGMPTEDLGNCPQ